EVKYSSVWVYPKEVVKITGRSRSGVSNLQKSFKEFVESYPKYFEPFFKKEYVILEGDDITQYNVLCFIHYDQNRTKLEAGLKPAREFKDEIKIIKSSGNKSREK